MRPAAWLLACACLTREAGAAPAVATFLPVGPGGGGALVVPSISPHDPNLLFVASEKGGVFRSGDGGASWNLIDKRQLRDAAAAPMVWHPVYGGWIYASGAGSLRMSKDAGVTWKPLCLNQPWGGEALTALAVDEPDAKMMLAGTSYGAFRSLDGGKTWGICVGVRGRTIGILIDPTTPPGNRIVVIGTTAGIFRSGDSGSRWHDSNGGLPARDLRAFRGAGDAKSGKIACYVTLPSRAVQGRLEGGVWRSLDHGATWQTAMGAGINVEVTRADAWGPGETAQYGRLAVPRAAPYTVWVTADGTGYWPPNHTTIYRTDDGGATWRAVVFGDPRGEASGIRANLVPGWLTADHVLGWWNGAGGGIAADDRYPDHAVFTDGGELYQTRDGGGIWTQTYSRPAEPGPPWKEGARWTSTGLDGTSGCDIVFDPHRPGRVLVGSSGAGLEASDDGGATWRWAAGGSPWRNTFYQLAFDPGIPGLVWAAASDQPDIPHWSSLEGPTGSGGVVVSRDFGVTWTPSGRGLPESPVTSVVMDPRSPKAARVLFASSYGKGVHRSDDGGRTWGATPAQPGREGNRHFFRLVVHPGGSVFCVVTGRRAGDAFPVPGGLWRSRDRGATWDDLTATLLPRWPGDAAVHPVDPNVIYLALASVPGRGDGGVYRTADGGKSWKKVLGEETLPQEISSTAHALFLSLDSQAPDTVYAGIPTHGLFATRNAGKTWTEVAGIPFAGCQRVAFDPVNAGTLWVTTCGGGVWRGSLP
ncbi:MAG: hypothetical protein AAB152_04815 [Candidatus Coatesbacteria bacterium]